MGNCKISFSNLLLFLAMCIPLIQVYCQINLAYMQPTFQSSEFRASEKSVAFSSLAVDGNIFQSFLLEEIAYCCHQSLEQDYVWWSVDLGQLSEILDIFVYFRKYGDEIVAAYEIYRTQGYSIRISNETSPQTGQICFVDLSFDLDNITRTRNHTSCTNIIGRYVHFTNKGSKWNIYPKTQKKSALLELCEVQVTGYPLDRFGCNNHNVESQITDLSKTESAVILQLLLLKKTINNQNDHIIHFLVPMCVILVICLAVSITINILQRRKTMQRRDTPTENYDAVDFPEIEHVYSDLTHAMQNE